MMSTLLMIILVFLVVCYMLMKSGVGKPIFMKLLSKFLAWDTNRMAKNRNQNKKLAEISRKLFSTMSDVIETVGGPVLEIGAGSGPNLQYYPDNVKLITIDLNDNYKPYLLKNLETYNHVKLEQQLVGNAEDMHGEVPDNSCSCVVSTLLLCCVDQPKTLEEIWRVLKPGGRFYFLEHIIEEPGTWMRWIQNTMNDTWKSLRANCQVIRQTDDVIKNFKFVNLNASIVYRPLPVQYSFASKSYIGYADKPLDS